MSNTKLPIVSVLMPLYNTPADHLREAIDSILNQSFTEFEYLIVNDSPDNTELDEIVESYADSRIRYFRNKKNIGLEGSTNRLIEESVGEYIAIFDHDDISLPERLEKEVEYLNDNPSIGVVSGQFRVFGNEDIITENPSSSDEIREMLMTVSCVSHTAAMFRRSVLDENNIRYEKEFFPASSYRIITRLALVTDIYNLPDLILHYRMDGNNTSIKHAEARVEMRRQIQLEYGEARLEKSLTNKGYKVTSVDTLGRPPFKDERRYYRVETGESDVLFVKSEIKSLSNEYVMTKRMFDTSPKYFVEPIELIVEGRNYLVMRWSDGPNLDTYLKNNTLTSNEKQAFIEDLYNIYSQLRISGIVHRDVTPVNIAVTSEGLKLIDLHFAVEFDDYRELEYIEDNIGSIGLLGEPFSAGMYKWDDAFSFVEIAKLICGESITVSNSKVKDMISHIGERVITPAGPVLRGVILDQKETIDELRGSLNSQTSLYEMSKRELDDIKMSMSYNLGLRISSPYRYIKKKFRFGKNK